MARKTKIETAARDRLDASAAPAEQQRETTIRRPGSTARKAVEEPSEPVAAGTAAPEAETSSPAPRAGSKIAQVIALLERAEGITLAELVEVTGWLPHTTRAALTGLKKKGRTIRKDKRGDVTCYRIEVAA